MSESKTERVGSDSPVVMGHPHQHQVALTRSSGVPFSAFAKRAAFSSRTSSQCSIISSSTASHPNLLLNETEQHNSRPATPISHINTDQVK